MFIFQDSAKKQTRIYTITAGSGLCQFLQKKAEINLPPRRRRKVNRTRRRALPTVRYCGRRGGESTWYRYFGRVDDEILRRRNQLTSVLQLQKRKLCKYINPHFPKIEAFTTEIFW